MNSGLEDIIIQVITELELYQSLYDISVNACCYSVQKLQVGQYNFLLVYKAKVTRFLILSHDQIRKTLKSNVFN